MKGDTRQYLYRPSSRVNANFTCQRRQARPVKYYFSHALNGLVFASMFSTIESKSTFVLIFEENRRIFYHTRHPSSPSYLQRYFRFDGELEFQGRRAIKIEAEKIEERRMRFAVDGSEKSYKWSRGYPALQSIQGEETRQCEAFESQRDRGAIDLIAAAIQRIVGITLKGMRGSRYRTRRSLSPPVDLETGTTATRYLPKS